MPDPAQLPAGDRPIDKADMAAYEKLKKELRDMMNKKRILEKNLGILEEQLYKYEGAYLEDTPNGNIIKGFDNYLKASSSSSQSSSLKRRATYTELDRLFSSSSVSYAKVSTKEYIQSKRF
ncbi:histone acetyltransferase subunit NuA4-domain-containing protein [Lipomyces oligophaga]|uniref:histone acetyltransferase subunit NuA4-domain-containing protein n=1 Tax=Lipomyces oligophaga TaxID=45792 RepID=UPI0034CFAD91